MENQVVQHISEWWPIVGMISGPILAIQVQKSLEKIQDSKQRKIYIFRTLMATRDPFSRLHDPEHIKALNQIEIAFYGKKFFRFQYKTQSEKKVQKAWKKYLDYLNSMGQFRDQNGLFSNDVLMNADNLFISLLDSITESLGYDFDEVDLRRGIYKPQLHLWQKQHQEFIQSTVGKVLTGEQAITVKLAPEAKSENSKTEEAENLSQKKKHNDHTQQNSKPFSVDEKVNGYPNDNAHHQE